MTGEREMVNEVLEAGWAAETEREGSPLAADLSAPQAPPRCPHLH